jgi:hypothetical protein
MTAVDETDLLSMMDTSGSAGAAKAEELYEASRVRFARTELFKLDENKVQPVRFLTDLYDHPEDPSIPVCLTVGMHPFLPTKERPEGYDKKWPPHMDAVCRNDKIFNGFFQRKTGDLKGCYICANDLKNKNGKKSWPILKTWALLALREESMKDGKFAGISTKMKAVSVGGDKDEKNASTEQVQDIRIARQGFENFFSKAASIGAMKRTVLDQDFQIKRKGGGINDTRYDFSPYGVLKLNFTDPETGQVRENIDFDLQDAAIRNAYFPNIPDLRSLILDLAKDDYYQKFWIPGDVDDSDDNSVGSGEVSTQASTPTPSNDQNPELMDALRARALGQEYTPGESNSGAAPAAASGLRAL